MLDEKRKEGLGSRRVQQAYMKERIQDSCGTQRGVGAAAAMLLDRG
jgi:hypothetical protein